MSLANLIVIGIWQNDRWNDRYQIVVGERRWRAVRRANLDQVLAVEKNVSCRSTDRGVPDWEGQREDGALGPAGATVCECEG
jgi:hypothetical protein